MRRLLPAWILVFALLGSVALAADPIIGWHRQVTLTATTEAELITINSGHLPRGGQCHLYSDQAGTARLYLRFPSDNIRLMRTQAVTANSLLTLDVDYKLPDMRWRFQPDAQPAAVETWCLIY